MLQQQLTALQQVAPGAGAGQLQQLRMLTLMIMCWMARRISSALQSCWESQQQQRQQHRLRKGMQQLLLLHQGVQQQESSSRQGIVEAASARVC
jgi:hypothetical protein